jgi:hypothetical protein
MLGSKVDGMFLCLPISEFPTSDDAEDLQLP